MKRWMIAALFLAAACNKSETSVAPEKTYPMTATIVSRDVAHNTVNLDNKKVPGVMEPMRMDYSLRGAKVESLPPNGAAVDVTLHERDGEYWVTDVKVKR